MPIPRYGRRLLWSEKGRRGERGQATVAQRLAPRLPVDEAVKWYRFAAAQGLAEAQYSLGVIYERGRGAAQNSTEAVKWYRLAAAQGFAAAQYNLGMMLYDGIGVSKDFAEAARLFLLAATQGHANARFELEHFPVALNQGDS